MTALDDPAARAAAPGQGGAPPGGFAALVPELSVTEIGRSLAFWCGTLGFSIAYDRPAARFAFLVRDRVQVMLCEANGRWDTGTLEPPLGRGINLQMMVARLDDIVQGLARAAWPVFEGPNEAWYRVGDQTRGQRELLVQDPDGYLLRLAEDIGTRPAP